MKKEVKGYLIIFAAIFFISGVFASYSIGTPQKSIEKLYSKGDNIKGWINASFANESASSLFKDSFGNSATLLNLLKSDSRHAYSCIPENCGTLYSTSNPAQTKTFSMNANEEKIIGFNFNSDITQMTNFSLTIKSDVEQQSNNQLKIDFLNDGKTEIGNTEAGASFSSASSYGCFNQAEPTIQEVIMVGTYCQRINLQEAPEFALGAWVKLVSGSSNLKMHLYDLEQSSEVGSCDLPSPTTQGGEISCNLKYLVPKKSDYYVCISNQGSGNYKIQGYTKDKCGFSGSPSSGNQETASYKIFSRPKTFAPMTELKIYNQLPAGEKITSMIENYMFEEYGDLDCDGKNCIIPIKLKSAYPQSIIIDGFTEYVDAALGGKVSNNLIYDISENPSLVNAGYQKIYLDNSVFTVPNNLGEYNFELELNNQQLFSEKIEVSPGISVLSINPIKTASGLPTKFKLDISAPQGINATKYEWDFGENNFSSSTLTPENTYTYLSVGTYSLSVKIEDSEGKKTSHTFTIEVSSASEILDDLITGMQNNLLAIKGQMSGYDTFPQEALKNVLDLKNSEDALQNLSLQYSLLTGATEAQYQEILSKVIEINLPSQISQSISTDPFPLVSKEESVNLDIAGLIAGGTYDASLSKDYEEALASWNAQNIQATISMNEFSADYGFGQTPILKTFKVEIINLDVEEPTYIFIEDMEGITFKEEKENESGYYYDSIKTRDRIEFYTTEDISIENLPIFFSPSLDSLSITEEPSKEKFKWGLFIVILVILISAGIAAYFALKKWYDQKYEDYLFKDKNDLYNIVTYIQSSKSQGMGDEIIRKNLKKAGWSGEKITYVMKKYYGKRIGMPGFSKKPIIKQQSNPHHHPFKKF